MMTARSPLWQLRTGCEQVFITSPCFCRVFPCMSRAWHQPLEMTAVNKRLGWGMGVSAAAAALVMFSMGASAQLAPTPPVTPKAATPTAPATVPATPKAPVAAKAAPKAAVAPAIVCKGRDEATCKGETTCSWVVPTKVNAATKKADAAYCRRLAGVAKTAADKAAADKKKAEAAAKAPPTAVKAPAAPAAPAAPKAVEPKKN